jgi:hypothetical protein
LHPNNLSILKELNEEENHIIIRILKGNHKKTHTSQLDKFC